MAAETSRGDVQGFFFPSRYSFRPAFPVVVVLGSFTSMLHNSNTVVPSVGAAMLVPCDAMELVGRCSRNGAKVEKWHTSVGASR